MHLLHHPAVRLDDVFPGVAGLQPQYFHGLVNVHLAIAGGVLLVCTLRAGRGWLEIAGEHGQVPDQGQDAGEHGDGAGNGGGDEIEVPCHGQNQYNTQSRADYAPHNHFLALGAPGVLDFIPDNQGDSSNSDKQDKSGHRVVSGRAVDMNSRYFGVFYRYLPVGIGDLTGLWSNALKLIFTINTYWGSRMKKTALAIALVSVFSMAQAEEPVVDAKRIYVGGGLGFNTAGGASAQGFQFLGGYEFNFIINDDITSALEIGYMDSGKFDYYYSGSRGDAAKGLWAAMVESVPLTNKTDMLARLGYDFGDDDGFMLGAGMQYRFNTKAALRTEYIARQHVNSLQVNVLFKF